MMRRTMLCLCPIALAGGGLLIAAAESSGGEPGTGDRAAVVKFLKGAVMGRTLAMPKTTWKRYDNKTEGDIEEQFVYHDLTESAHGFQFDVTAVVKATFYDLDGEGRRIMPGRPWSGTSVSRYEIGERASTGRLTGFSRTLSTTNKERRPAGTCWLVTAMRVGDGKLTWEETLAVYGDSPGPGGTYRPISADAKKTFSLVGGRLREEYEGVTFAVDPDALRRSPGRDGPLKTVSEEIADR